MIFKLIQSSMWIIFFTLFILSTTFIDIFFTFYSCVDNNFSTTLVIVDNFKNTLQHSSLFVIILLFLLWIIFVNKLFIHKM
jgi:hypothetical protein